MFGDVSFLPSGADLVASVKGEVDDLTSRALGRAIMDEARCGTYRRLVIDLRAVSFLGSSGLSMLLDVRRTAGEAGTETTLLCQPASTPMRILTITKLDEVFAIHADLGDALADGDGHGP